MSDSHDEQSARARLLIGGLILLAIGPFAWANHRQIYGACCTLLGAGLIITGIRRRGRHRGSNAG